MSNDNSPFVPVPPIYRRDPFGPQPLSPALRPQWPMQSMQDHLACAFRQACDVWRHRLPNYLRMEPGEVCVPKKPLHEATELAILTLDHLPRDVYLKIADGLAIAAFHEVLREQTAGRLENFAVARHQLTPPPSGEPVVPPPAPDPTHVEAWNKAHEVAFACWLALLPRGLPEAEYEPYRFHQIREHVLAVATATLIRFLPASVAADIAWAATPAAFYSAVAALEYEDLE
ncbi:MAG: hypothetical protein ACJ8AW_37895 [Rhodopila sp.]